MTEFNHLYPRVLSPVATSNLYTIKRASKYQKVQEVPFEAQVPSFEVRQLRARLILEEALETIHALGFDIQMDEDSDTHLIPLSDSFNAQMANDPNYVLKDIIDGACDTIYVCTGLLMSCGVPDMPHLMAVCRANDAKFPEGIEPVFNEQSGKYLKPEGWKPPDHQKVLDIWKDMNLSVWGDVFVSKESK